ncbi:leucine--tRNA ligase [Candidatus Parcubacteria bacterium]|nr:MAG: leucine--tRNA ligase [Candidatus Parcubacteria bacterium]
MAHSYDPHTIEAKWQARWAAENVFAAREDLGKRKSYLLVEFPYPSGAGLHVGHVRSYSAMDAIARKRRREGQEVLYPMGWDAFGLPTENYAIKTGRPPQEITQENIATFRRQLQSLGLSFDWNREINTTDPSYYRWTQWIFIQLFKRGLAYKAKGWINWCPSCKIGLANEEVVDGGCERCGAPVEKKEREQWMLRITAYAQRLYDDLDTVDYIERAKVGQRNWIGPSKGAIIPFALAGEEGEGKEVVEVFTTRADTLFGVTFLVLAPEHPAVERLLSSLSNRDEVDDYVKAALKKKDFERTAEGKEKTGILLKGIIALHPATKDPLPVFVADYVLPHYGTGAVMGVPAHDERDGEFAQRYHLPIKQVVRPHDGSVASLPFAQDGVLVNSGQFDGMTSEEARKAIMDAVGGREHTTYRLRDWVFSRQRYWGEPIPMVYCERCGWQPLPEESLPLELPELKEYQPTEEGDSPLARLEEWVRTTCPACGGPARRETDVMPNWAGSSWYYLRYTDPYNNEALASSEKLAYWMPVDWYNGGMEHTTLHLLYSRFWHKFLYDIGVVPTQEPYARRTSQGLILAADGSKMSKSKGNTVNPDEVVEQYGADTLRAYEMFMGPFDQPVAWSINGLVGIRRFLERVWSLLERVEERQPSQEALTLMHRTIKKVSEDIEAMKFNTAIAALMEYTNALMKEASIPKTALAALFSLLEPFAPHIAHEGWERLAGKGALLCKEPWPQWDPAVLQEGEVTVAVQINGKTRATVSVAAGSTEEDIHKAALAHPRVAQALAQQNIQRVVVVPGRVVNFVVRERQ